MPLHSLYRAAVAAVCLLLLTAVAYAADGTAAFLSKRGQSGQVYVWNSGSC